MATFKRSVITRKGKELMSRILANETDLIFTKIETTDFKYLDNIDITQVLTLDNPKQSVNISNITKKDSKVIVHSIFTNEGLLNTYNINGVGIYAKDRDNTEILFALLVAENGDTMASQLTNTITSITLDFVFTISDTTNIKIEVDSNSTVTVKMLNSFKDKVTNEYVKKIDYSTEENYGIIKLFGLEEAETKSDKFKNIVESNRYSETEQITKYFTESEWVTSEYYNKIDAQYEQETNRFKIVIPSNKNYWDTFAETLNHTKSITESTLLKYLKKVLKPATENGYGLITENRIKRILPIATDTTAGIVTLNKIREVSPRPDLSPYITFDKGYRNNNKNDWVIRANNDYAWTPHIIDMYNASGGFTGSFHTNGGRAYYRVPSRNGNNWNEIMDNHDMAVRDNNIQHAHNRITDTWNRADDAWNKANDAQVNRIYEIRLAGHVQVNFNSGTERSGYVLTNVIRRYGWTQDQVTLEYRALQFFRNGQWVNSYFA